MATRIKKQKPKVQPKSNKQEMDKFLEKGGVPAWFRGYSGYQSKAFDDLWFSIRDDTAQETTYRTHANLRAIGFKPMVSHEDVKRLLALCRCSDIFFLWSLKELYYKSPEPNTYNVNEQLIMSALVRLDTVTTLRGLEQVLPPPQPTKAEMQKQQQEEIRIKEAELAKCRKARAELKRNTTDIYGNKKIRNPYFTKLVRPKTAKRILHSEPPLYKVDIDKLEPYKDKMIRVFNEKTRWFADYKFQPGKRCVKSILDERIAHICKGFEKLSINPKTVDVLCEYHKEQQELEEKLKTKMQTVIQEKFADYFDTTIKKRKDLAESWRAKMENDQIAFLCDFRRKAEEARKKFTVLVLKNDTEYECRGVDLEPADDIECAPLPDCPSCPNIICDEDDWEGHEKQKRKARRQPEQEIDLQNLENNSDNQTELIFSPDTSFDVKDLIYKDERELERLRLSNYSYRYVSRYDYGGRPELVSPPPSQAYFKAPEKHSPHSFDYRKIFKFKNNNKSKIDIRRAFVEALNNDIDQLIALHKEKNEQKDIDGEQIDFKRLGDWEKPNVDKAVTECAKTMFLKGAKIKRKEICKQEAEDRKKAELLKSGKRTLLETFQDTFNQDYYDPDDKQLMQAMLKHAFELLAKNPKYVLASLPGAYNLPVFREFIYSRFGKTYTKEERFKSYLNTIHFLRKVQKHSLKVRDPADSDMGSIRFASYRCERYYNRKGKMLRKNFNENFDEAVMDESRLLWFALRPYLCGRPPRKTFFAYMPASKNLITHTKVWNPREHMDGFGAHEKRMAEEAAKEK